MLLLSFSLSSERYAVDASSVVEVMPLTANKPIPRAPDFVVGLLDYRGAPVPLIDLCQLTLGQPYNKVLSTRIVLVDYPTESGEQGILGLIAEKVTETLRCSAQDLNATGISLKDAPYLGPVLSQATGMLQIVDVSALLPDEVQEMLFPKIQVKVEASAP